METPNSPSIINYQSFFKVFREYLPYIFIAVVAWAYWQERKDGKDWQERYARDLIYANKRWEARDSTNNLFIRDFIIKYIKEEK